MTQQGCSRQEWLWLYEVALRSGVPLELNPMTFGSYRSLSISDPVGQPRPNVARLVQRECAGFDSLYFYVDRTDTQVIYLDWSNCFLLWLQ